MARREPNGIEILEGADLNSQIDSGARIETQTAFLGFMMAVALIGMFIVLVATHFNPIALAWLIVLIGALSVGLFWSRSSARRRGTPANIVLTTRVKADLLTELNATHVHVESSEGVVTLQGTVPYADFREAAEHIARRAGAQKVVNEVEVSASHGNPADGYLQGFAGVTTPEGAPEVTHAPTLEESIFEALEADPRVNAHLIDVQVELGIAYLTGRQGTVQARQAATEVVAHLPGILGVSNEIEVMPGI